MSLRGKWVRVNDAEERLRKLIASLPRAVSDWREVPCAEWVAGYDKDGYPKICYVKKTFKASRVAFLIDRGHLPRHFACHHCDNRKCIHPDHLFDGTVQENTRDRLQKYSHVDRDRIVDLRRNGARCTEIALWLKVSHAQVSRVSRGVSQRCA